jgi:hypothetical protein
MQSQEQSNAELKKNYSLLHENLSQQQNSMPQEVHEEMINELNAKHSDEI